MDTPDNGILDHLTGCLWLPTDAILYPVTAAAAKRSET